MSKRTKSLLAASLFLNVIFIIFAIFFVSKKYPSRLMTPYLRDYYINKLSLFQTLKTGPGGIIFVGDSLTDRCEWAELFGRADIINRGIDADTSDGVLNRISEITSHKPDKIFIMIGGNDFIIGRKVPEIVRNYMMIIERVRAESPRTKIYIQSNLPTLFRLVPLPRKDIRELNRTIKTLADNKRVFYLDIYSTMIDLNGDLKSEYTTDGAHLNGAGYQVWRDAIIEYLK